MIEAVCDAVQLVVLAACLGLSLWRAFKTRATAWLMLACFFGCMFLGNVNWVGYQVVFGETPRPSFIEDLTWTAGYLFLVLIEKQCDEARAPSPPVPAAWIPVAVCAACCAYFIYIGGKPILNIADNGLLAAVGFFAVRGLAARLGEPLCEDPSPSAQDDKREPAQDGLSLCHAERSEASSRSGMAHSRLFHGAMLAYVIVEEALWLSSCFLWPGEIVVVGPYIVFNYALTLASAAVLAAAWRCDEL